MKRETWIVPSLDISSLAITLPTTGRHAHHAPVRWGEARIVFKRHGETLNIRAWLGRHPRPFRAYRMYSLYRQKKFRVVTSPLRKLPDFVIIGAAKSGTTSLYDYVTKHSHIKPAYTKEPHYFSSPEGFSLLYYKTNFPILTKQLTGEASTGYLSSPEAPARMKAAIPNTKIIAILRNPVDRAYSHYHFARRQNVETSTTFEEALELEESRRKEYKEAISELKSVFCERGVLKQGDLYQLLHNSSKVAWASYLRYGHYAYHLENWFRHYSRDQFLVLSTEDLRRDRQDTLDQVFEFLGVSPYKVQDFKNLNVGRYKKMREDTRQKLVEYFRPHNERLYSLLNCRFDWDS